MTIALVGLATFIAAAVEWVEALTIVLAVGTVKSWRSSFAGTALALAALLVLVLVFGVALTAYVPIALVRTLVGVFLLLFGLKWLYKAILRSSGLKALHDEAAAFAETKEQLLSSKDHWIGLATSFNGVFLEGLEVVFIVIALGGLKNVPAAVVGALASLVVVAGVGVAFRSPLTAVPENTMKYVVGIMLTSFGTFFAGEGIGVSWWRDDVSLLPLIAIYGLASLALVQYLKHPPAGAVSEVRGIRAARAVVNEVWGLFVDDGSLAIFAVAGIFAVAVFADRVHGQGLVAGALLVLLVLVAIVIGLSGPAKARRLKAKSAAQPQHAHETRAGSPVEAASS
jgi:uncharacterized membrane protein